MCSIPNDISPFLKAINTIPKKKSPVKIDKPLSMIGSISTNFPSYANQDKIDFIALSELSFTLQLFIPSLTLQSIIVQILIR